MPPASTRTALIVLALATVVAIVLLGARALGKDDEATGRELGPLFDPATGFASQTDNCPDDSSSPDVDAAEIVSLADSASAAANAVEPGAAVRSVVVEWETRTLRYTYSAAGEDRLVHVAIPDAFEPGAVERMTVKAQALPGVPDDLPSFKLDGLRTGPSAVVELVRDKASEEIQRFFSLTLFPEGCHLVWGVIANTKSGATLFARVNSTTGELHWEPSPFPTQTGR